MKDDNGCAGNMKHAVRHLERDMMHRGAKQIEMPHVTAPMVDEDDHAEGGMPHPHEKRNEHGV